MTIFKVTHYLNRCVVDSLLFYLALQSKNQLKYPKAYSEGGAAQLSTFHTFSKKATISI